MYFARFISVFFVVNMVGEGGSFHHEGHEDHEGEAGDQGMEKRTCTADLDGLSDHLIG